MTKPSDDVGIWQNVKNCVIEVADDVCGRAKKPLKHKEIWWLRRNVAY